MSCDSAAWLQAAREGVFSEPTMATTWSWVTRRVQTCWAVWGSVASSTWTNSSRRLPARWWALMSSRARFAPWMTGSALALPSPVSGTTSPILTTGSDPAGPAADPPQAARVSAPARSATSRAPADLVPSSVIVPPPFRSCPFPLRSAGTRREAKRKVAWPELGPTVVDDLTPQLEARRRGQHLLQHHPQLEPGERGRRALVDAVAEGQVPGPPVEDEPVRVVEDGGVAVGGAEQHGHRVPGTDPPAPDLDLPGRGPDQHLARRGQSEGLLHRGRDQLRSRPEQVLHLRPPGEVLEAAGDPVGGAAVSGHDHHPHAAGDPLDRDRPALDAGRQQPADHVRSRRPPLPSSGLHQPARVFVQLGAQRPRPLPVVGRQRYHVTAAAGLDPLGVGLREVQPEADGPQGQVRREPACGVT